MKGHKAGCKCVGCSAATRARGMKALGLRKGKRRKNPLAVALLKTRGGSPRYKAIGFERPTLTEARNTLAESIRRRKTYAKPIGIGSGMTVAHTPLKNPPKCIYCGGATRPDFTTADPSRYRDLGRMGRYCPKCHRRLQVGELHGNPRRGSPPNMGDARELFLFIENDADLYRQQYMPIMLNLAHKVKAGKYDKVKAVKLWGYLAESGAKKYAREFGTASEWAQTFPPATRKAVAAMLARKFMDQVRSGEFVGEHGGELGRLLTGKTINPIPKFPPGNRRPACARPGCSHSYSAHVAFDYSRPIKAGIPRAVLGGCNMSTGLGRQTTHCTCPGYVQANPWERVRYKARTARKFRLKRSGRWRNPLTRSETETLLFQAREEARKGRRWKGVASKALQYGKADGLASAAYSFTVSPKMRPRINREWNKYNAAGANALHRAKEVSLASRIGNPRRARRAIPPKLSKAFKKFHGKMPTGFGSSVNFPERVTALVYLGEARSIDYDSAKKLNGSHKLRAYRHKFERGVRLYTTPDRRWLVVGGGKFRVTDWLRG